MKQTQDHHIYIGIAFEAMELGLWAGRFSAETIDSEFEAKLPCSALTRTDIASLDLMAITSIFDSQPKKHRHKCVILGIEDHYLQEYAYRYEGNWSGEELETMLHLAFEHEFSLENIYLDFTVNTQQGFTSGIAYACSKELIDEYLAALGQVNLKVARIVPHQMALVQAQERYPDQPISIAMALAYEGYCSC